jgi:hypothetical protein
LKNKENMDMKTIVCEPEIEYKKLDWLSKAESFTLDGNIWDIQDNSIIFLQPSGTTISFFIEKPRKKLSLLRGKLSKQSEEEIDDQLSKLRGEWDRNI